MSQPKPKEDDGSCNVIGLVGIVTFVILVVGTALFVYLQETETANPG